MKYYHCIIKFRAYGFVHEEHLSSKENFTLEKSKKIIAKKFGETSVVISVKIGDRIIENEDYSEFKIVGKESTKYLKKKL